MTHHTDAERAEFEAWLEPSYSREKWHTGEYTDDTVYSMFAAWQAARRAPAAPVPQGVVEPIETVKYWRDAYANPQGDEHFMGHGMVVKIFDDYLGMLAAAPQPPEAAPVQLPEPDSYCFQHEETGLTQYVDAQQVEWGFEKNNPRWKRVGAAYSEQQVRELLAAHGIQERST
ncbi:hypothetical protein [Comamonas aquatica]|uniref:hypothetical protein n=1 Tax=Comamonas aquatica TaxID=225991 RepID=UPI0039188C92